MAASRRPSTTPPRHSVMGGCLSLLCPGLGHLIRGCRTEALWIWATGIFLGLGTWILATLGGFGAGYFFGMLIILPWWCLQAYGAYHAPPHGQRETWKIVWRNGHDLRYLGALFLLTALMDFYIIVANPEYGLTVFCTKPAGAWGILAKAQSPILHVLIGYGFLRLQRWSLLIYLAYAGFGLSNALANYACFGYGRIRTVFFISLLAFTFYVVWRKDHFKPQKSQSS